MGSGRKRNRMPTGRISLSNEVGECFAVNVHRGIPRGRRKRGRAGVARLNPVPHLGLGAAMRRCVMESHSIWALIFGAN